MADAKRDQNRITTLLGVSNVDGVTPTLIKVNPSTNALIIEGGGGGEPGGSDTQVQFNDAGAFGGDAGFTYNKTTDAVTIAGNISITGAANQENVINESAVDQNTRIEGDTLANLLFLDAGQDSIGINSTDPDTNFGTGILFGVNGNLNTNAIQAAIVNTTGSSSDAGLRIGITGDSFGIGIDNSDSDKLKISYGDSATNAVLGTNDLLSFENNSLSSIRAPFIVGMGLTAATANFAVIAGNQAEGGAGSSIIELLSTATTARIVENGQSGSVGADKVYASHIVSAGIVTEAASGTTPMAAQLAVKALTYNNGSGATTNGATLYVEGAAGGTATITNNYAMWVDAGISRFDGTVSPGSDSAVDLGTSALYWANTYTDKIFLNSTATLDGSTAGVTTIGGSIVAENTLSGKNALTITIDEDTGIKSAIYAKNDTNYALDASGAVAVFEVKNGTDAAPAIKIINAGTGADIYMGSGASTIGFTTDHMSINKGAGAGVYLFEGAATGERPEFRIYGYANDLGTPAIAYASLYLDTYGSLLIGAQTSGAFINLANNVLINGNANFGLYLGQYGFDSMPIVFGQGADASIYYDSADLVINTALVGTGVLKLANASNWTANGSGTVTISNVAPAGVGTATISKWLTIKDSDGTVMYIPAFT